MIWKTLYRIFMVVGIYFTAAGFVGFLSLAVSAEGAFDFLGSKAEWPMGYSQGVALTADGHRIAINEMAGRVQFYDSDWTFLWGMRIESGGGIFKISAVKEDRFELVTARLNNLYVIDFSGKVLAKGNYPESVWYNRFDNVGRAGWVPTYFFLIPFASPYLAFLSIFFGAMLLIGVARFLKERAQLDSKQQ